MHSHFRFVPSSAIRWKCKHNFLAPGCNGAGASICSLKEFLPPYPPCHTWRWGTFQPKFGLEVPEVRQGAGGKSQMKEEGIRENANRLKWWMCCQESREGHFHFRMECWLSRPAMSTHQRNLWDNLEWFKCWILSDVNLLVQKVGT